MRRLLPHRSFVFRAMLLALAWLPAGVARAQFAVPWWTIDGGGGTSSNGVHAIAGTIGQWDAANVHPAANDGTGLGIDGGFWPPLAESDPAPPQIDTQPVSAPAVTPGDCISLFVEATGIPLPRYQWRRNGIRLPGATNPVLDLCLTNEATAASYDVIVSNPLGFARSQPAVVGLALDPLPFSVDFATRGTITGKTGRGVGDNLNGKRTPGDPLHDGRRGGKTVWVIYHAPATGILTLDTRGSSFDTLLAVYTGFDRTLLVPVASDDDNGGFYRSLVRCRVVAGTDYVVAIDGRAGESGHYELNWDLLETATIPPRFVRQPSNTTVHRGDKATFSAIVLNAGSLQWQHRGVALQDDNRIQGSGTATLTIAGAKVEDAGNYRLVATTGGIEIDSELATLHFDLAPGGGPAFPGAAAFDKFADARDDLIPPSSSGGRAAAPSAALPGGLARGGPFLTRTDDYGTSQHETSPCGVFAGATAWFYYQAETNGLVVLDTNGSTYDTIAGVYVDLTGDPDNLTPAGCNDDADEVARTSRVIFNANAALYYSIVVGGKDDASGTLVAQVRPVATTLLAATGFDGDDRFNIDATAEPGLRLVLEYAPNLAGTWTPAQTNSVASAGTTTYRLARGSDDAIYFRARPDASEYPMISITP